MFFFCCLGAGVFFLLFGIGRVLFCCLGGGVADAQTAKMLPFRGTRLMLATQILEILVYFIATTCQMILTHAAQKKKILLLTRAVCKPGTVNTAILLPVHFQDGPWLR